LACLGSVTWDYFEYEKEAKDWAYNLDRMGVNAKYLGEKSGRYIVQKIEETPHSIMDKMPKPFDRKIF
jgi:hypothetical protein